jgi:signal transduction histidine kinase
MTLHNTVLPEPEAAALPVPSRGTTLDGAPVTTQLPASASARGEVVWLEGGLALLDSLQRCTHVNEPLVQWLGAAPEQLAGQPFGEVLGRRCPEGVPLLARAWSEAAPSAEYQFPAPQVGPSCWLRLEVARNPAGWFVRLNSVLPPMRELVEEGGGGRPGELPEQQQLRLRLLRAESQLESLMQRWPGVVFSQRPDFSFHYVKGSIEALTGVTPEAWCSQPRRFWEVVHEADVDELKRQCRQAARMPAGVTTTYRLRHAVTGKMSYILEHRQAAVSRSGLVLGYEGLWLDVTRQTLAEKRLSTAAWKETLALVTMGLAHDFSNQLSGILSLTELVLSQLGRENPSAPTLDLIKQSALQASQLVHRIVNLHRSKTGLRQYLDLNQIVSELGELVRKVLPRRIVVETELAPGQLPVYLEAVEFRQVVLNLALNAADAMPQRGRLSFRVSVHTAAPTLTHCQGEFPRLPCVCLAVQDNGTGIAARHLPHIFDPFFTTKPLTKGSGLGLYNARMFVQEHGGAVSVESTEGAGTTFCLWLPQADFTEAERMAAENAERRRSVLLVGQPGLATESVTEFLRTHNFYVVATHSPARALELLATEESSLHGVVVLADPGDSAMLALIPDLRARHPAKQTALQLIGGTADQIDNRVLDSAGLVLASNLEESVLLQKLNGLFTMDPPP